MLEVRLHGALAAQFGRLWHFDVATPREAVDALECARRGFREALLRLDSKGYVFRVRTRGHDYSDDDIELRATERLDIIPIVRGASANLRFVAGAALTYIGYSMSWTGIGAVAGGLGVSLMLGAVTEWLAPIQKREDPYEAKESWSFSGPTNTADQGVPVPIIYGEVLTGSVPISAGLAASDMTPSGIVAPAVVITGTRDYTFFAGAGGYFTVVINLSASPYNLLEPYAYTWTLSGFAGAAAVRLLNNAGATVRLEVDYNVAPGATVTDSGNLSVSLTGIDSVSQLNPITVNASAPVTLAVSAEIYQGGAGN